MFHVKRIILKFQTTDFLNYVERVKSLKSELNSNPFKTRVNKIITLTKLEMYEILDPQFYGATSGEVEEIGKLRSKPQPNSSTPNM